MTVPEDSPLASQREESPYASPPIVNELPLTLSSVSMPAMSVVLILTYSGVATGLTLFAVVAINKGLPDNLWILVMASPPLVIAGFMAIYCRTTDLRGPVAAISTAWKVLALVLVPPASMICFIPACIGSGIFIMPVFDFGMRDFGLFIPIFIAYVATCFMVAYRMRSRIMRRASVGPPSYSEIVPAVSHESPYSVPEARKPE